MDIYAHLRGDLRCVLGGNAYYVLDLLLDLLGVRGGQVYLVDDRNYFKVVFDCEIGVGKGLRLDSLRSVNDEQGSLAGNQ